MTAQHEFFTDFRARLADLRSLADQMAQALGEIERAAHDGRYPVPGLVLARCLVAIDAVAAELAREAEALANAVDPLALTRQRGQDR